MLESFPKTIPPISRVLGRLANGVGQTEEDHDLSGLSTDLNLVGLVLLDHLVFHESGHHAAKVRDHQLFLLSFRHTPA